MDQHEVINELVSQVADGHLGLGDISGLDNNDLEALYGYGLQKLECNCDEEAAAVFAGLLVFEPIRADYWRAYGVALQRLNHLERAVRAYSAAEALEPQVAYLHVYRAEAYLLLGDPMAAQRDLLMAGALGATQPLEYELESRMSLLIGITAQELEREQSCKQQEQQLEAQRQQRQSRRMEQEQSRQAQKQEQEQRRQAQKLEQEQRRQEQVREQRRQAQKQEQRRKEQELQLKQRSQEQERKRHEQKQQRREQELLLQKRQQEQELQRRQLEFLLEQDDQKTHPKLPAQPADEPSGRWQVDEETEITHEVTQPHFQVCNDIQESKSTQA